MTPSVKIVMNALVEERYLACMLKGLIILILTAAHIIVGRNYD